MNARQQSTQVPSLEKFKKKNEQTEKCFFLEAFNIYTRFTFSKRLGINIVYFMITCVVIEDSFKTLKQASKTKYQQCGNIDIYLVARSVILRFFQMNIKLNGFNQCA